MELVLAANVLLDPIVAFLSVVLHSLTAVTHNFGWSLVVLAVLVKLVFWPLNTMQFRSIARMQALQPQIKALQAKYKGEPQKLQQEQMALYREQNVNPFASCLPLLLQLPILWSLYYAIYANRAEFAKTSWAWIGSPLSHATAGKLLATSLQQPDYLLLALYVVSMYFSVRFSSPAVDPQQAQQQKIMAFISPVMIAFIGRFWPSALILYWLTFNVLTMAQQFYLMRGTRPAPAAADPQLPDLPAGAARDGAASRKGVASGSVPGGNGSSRRQRRRKGSRR
ncbi:MAG: membrane protein insertase YidC [Candidatus Eremiobacteraeota bacterium]|nr:membrane protein insertase YidC [Candidatus Eremiobacteraeota bacterium]MBV9646511.1 membrane protein insertase YidC [Candidatus Eremiobacteraeota bacterium]